jgi:hypothetical protein
MIMMKMLVVVTPYLLYSFDGRPFLFLKECEIDCF